MSLVETFVAYIITINETLNIEFNEYNNPSSVLNDYPNYDYLCPIFYDCVHDINSTITDDRDSIKDEPDDLESSVIFIETEESCKYQNMAGIYNYLKDNSNDADYLCLYSYYGCCQISFTCDIHQAYDDELKGTGLTQNNSLGWNFDYSFYLDELKFGNHPLDITKMDSDGTNCPSIKEITKDYMLSKYHEHQKSPNHQHMINVFLLLISFNLILLCLYFIHKDYKKKYENLEQSPETLNDGIEP